MRPIHGEPLSVLSEPKGAADAAPLYLLGSMVAGARNAECYTVSEVYWVDLVKPVPPKNPFNTPTDSTVSIP